MKIGKYKLSIIESGFFGLDGGAMFGIVPKPLWERTNPADDSNRIRLSTRHLILESESKKIIIDTGIGDKWDDKFKSIYAVDEKISMSSALAFKGLKAEDITDVILTHLHFDHTGGSTISVEGKLKPAFPNAKFYIQKKNYDWAINPSDRDKGSYLKENFLPLFEEGLLNFTTEGEQFDDEIEFITVNGHTFGQQMVKISDSNNTFLFCADLIPTYSHIPLPYIMGYDLQPLVTLQEKKKYLKLAVDENWKLFFGHDPEFAFATVKKLDKGYFAEKKFKSFEEY
ncbi:MAG: MBL fold metallo-hydrolase [Ignavibacteriaceae bacterium]|jgi:glyoxylase-like metal-dependent hydrolase (beta-lactamase superfamily II)|nr:MBL fold metallo-hydrolase [Chlorobium sp.]MCW8817530.1 MBL fold metallo-hydrolase [Ignavibacteriaceae bacterium]MCW8960773.1 MBL fold metallo-hydrolase [Ignavibacteriaceae bacterium]MCW9095631.1 MBL fold metallo-hydrolase [Ignavibacteriaceae bacterium]MCW9097480.1 MBL fold metallo-hydrolase [Ignavibacteriaceae bacterium]